MATVRQRVLTGASLSAVVLVLFLVNARGPRGLVPGGIALALLALSVRELGSLGTLGGPLLRRVLAAAGLGVTLLAGLVLLLDRPALLAETRSALPAVYGAALVLGLAGLALPERGAAAGRGARARGALLLALWLAPPFALLVFFERGHGAPALGALIVLAKIGDVFGYFVGRAIGKRRPFPRISPNKTLAGCVASGVSATLAGPLAVLLLGLAPLAQPGGRLLAGALLGLSLNLAAQAGDLLESAVKRSAGVKDSSALLGASGGVLDVVDSLLLATPVAVLLWPLVLGAEAGGP